ncbi:MAG: hypothetical protein HQL36_01980 [Alphaproteobacteria bacterium]|nr:hypothetical protein [Alphaproteobacteria bacterium]
MSKAQFAREVGLSRGRISQLIGQGLPVREDGKIDRETALGWMEKNLDPSRRKAVPIDGVEDPAPAPHSLDGAPSLKDLKSVHEAVKVKRAKLQYERELGKLVDREDVERVILTRARRERDTHLAWVMRTAPVIAGELGADPGDVFAVLDRHMREHLEDLSKTPLEELENAKRG